MTFSPFDHPHFATLFGRDDLALLFAPETEIDAMLRFEEALALAEADLGVIPKEAAAAIAEAIGGPEVQRAEHRQEVRSPQEC